MATLSSLLVQRGVASMRSVEDAIARQVLSGGDLATNLLEIGAAREDDVTHLAAESTGLVALTPGPLQPIDPVVLRLLPGEVAARHGLFPIEKRGGDLVVATSQPLSQSVEDDLGFLLNLNLRPMYALRARIEQALHEHYGVPIERRYARLVAKLEGRKPASDTEPPAKPKSISTPPEAPKIDAPVMTPVRPTLRGIPRISEEQVEAFISEAPAGTPALEPIDLSPRPGDARAAAASVELLVAHEPADALAALAPVDAPRAESVETTASEEARVAAAPRPEGVPQAIAAWARASEERSRADVRDRRQGRARRKGPFPVPLAEEEMQSAVTTDGVLDVLFDFAQQYFEYSALFVIHGDIAEGRDAAGRGADRDRVTAIGLPLDLPSTLATARDRRVPVLTDFAPDGLDAELLRDLGRAPPSEGIAPSPTAPSQRAAAVVIPIVVRGRTVAVLFGDDSPSPVELAGIGEVIAFAALAGASVERIILRKKLVKPGAPAARHAPDAIASAKAASSVREVKAVVRPVPITTAPAATRAGVAALARMFSSGGASATEAPAPGAPATQERTSVLVASVVDSFAPSKPLAREEAPPLAQEEAPPLAQEEASEPEAAGEDADSGVPIALVMETPPAAETLPGPHALALLSAETTPDVELAAPEESAYALPDAALETVEPAPVHDAQEDEPPPDELPPDELPLEQSSEAPSEADTALVAAAPPDEGRVSAPVVLDISGDTNGGLSDAIARAAEAVGERFAPLAHRSAQLASSPPPEETWTEGFPAVRASSGQLSPELPAALPFVTPPLPGLESALSQVPLDALLARAARGPEVEAARMELAQRAERNLAPLLALFPGPLDQDRHRSLERLPPASQCGPLLEAFADAGARGAATVAVLARHDDIDVRFWAAHLLGEILCPEAVDGLLSFLVDPDPAVRRIALRSAGLILAASLPGRPLEAALGYLSRDAHTPLRERLAAVDAMGQLRTGFFVPILVGLLSAIPEEVGEAARRALLIVTRQDFGRDAGRWTEWWSKNEGRHRIEWLIDALMHDTQSIRRAAGDELKQLTKEYFGYYDDLPKRERERAQERYREWWEREGRDRFV